MGQMSLAEAAVSGGTKSSTTLSDEKRTLLDRGDIEGLMRINRRQYGGFFMGPEDDDSDNSDDDSDDDGDDDSDDGDDGDDDKEKDDSKTLVTQLRGEAKKFRLRASERAKRIAELEAQVESLKGKKPVKKAAEDDTDDGDDGATEEVGKVKAENQTLARQNEDLLIRLEFMSNSKHEWANPKAALKLLDLSAVEITEDGEVEGLEEAIDELAKNEPYLLKPKDDDSDEEGKEKRKVGQKTGTRKKGEPNRDALLKKYPALRR